jgi:hypothetical protein
MNPIESATERGVRRLMALGLLPLSFYSWFIFYGTYTWFSWDIVEPIAYFMCLSFEMVLMSLFFIGSREEYSNSWFYDFLKKRSLEKNKKWVELNTILGELQNEKDDLVKEFQVHLLKDVDLSHE